MSIVRGMHTIAARAHCKKKDNPARLTETPYGVVPYKP